MTRTLIASSLVCGTVLALSGCKTTEPAPTSAPASMGAVNDTCPISGEAVDAGSPTVEYMGTSVGLCCDGCKGGWDKMTDEAKRAKVAGYTK